MLGSPREQFLDPVRLRPLAFLGRAVRLGQARGPSAAAREKNLTKFIFTSSFINTLKINKKLCTKLIGDGVGGIQKSFFKNIPNVRV